ncbi:XRE family transcriptional regulator [Bacillus benzoevorans]|uniref:XRE family transcriptional regulator n=1 Tax=Bacillus benzoevorans TaxID=1456 RepID=UPI00366AB038
MAVSIAALAAKEARKEVNKTQLKMSLDTNISAESISHQENGRYKVQPSICKYYLEQHNNPFVAMEAAVEYIGWGPTKLDGEAADLHRSNVFIKINEELDEMKKSLQKVEDKITKHPRFISDWERKDFEESIQETIDVITGANHYVAILCKELEISWVDMWEQHFTKLVQKGFKKSWPVKQH